MIVAEVAERAGVSVRTVRGHLASGRLKGQKIGRDWHVTEAACRAWLRTYTPYDTLRGKRGRR